MLHLNDVTLRIGGRLLLEQASVHLPAGQRIGLVGANGSGKTSLLRLILGELSPDAGEVRLRRHAASTGSRRRRRAASARRARRCSMPIASGRGCCTPPRPRSNPALSPRSRPGWPTSAPTPRRRGRARSSPASGSTSGAAAAAASFSGGWRMRTALAAVLFAEPDLLLLDEPTNHLDLEASLWLEDYLRRYPKTLLLVSHDRDLLNRVPERIVHLDQRRLTSYAGGYDAFERIRREKLVLQAKERARIEARRAHAGVRRPLSLQGEQGAPGAEPAEGDREAGADPAGDRGAHVVLRFPQPKLPAPPLITLERAAAGYGDHVVLERLDLRLDPDDRIALLGANGNGKSTFAKLLAGELAPLSGEVIRRRSCGSAISRSIRSKRCGRATARCSISRGACRGARGTPAHPPRRLRPDPGQGELPAGVLSGGEKARLTLALISAEAPQFLVLDEPTNHLDIDARDALVEAINGFAGAVC